MTFGEEANFPDSWQQLLDDLSSALRLNIFLQNCGELEYKSNCGSCHLCRYYREPEVGTGKDSVADCREYRTGNKNLKGAMLKASRNRKCGMEADMPFQECFQIAGRLIDIINERDGNINEKTIKEHMSLLRQFNLICLPAFRSQEQALFTSLGIMLDVSLIIFRAEGCWLEYMVGDKNIVLEKGICRARKEFWSRGGNRLVYATIDGANIWGIICIESPANIVLAEPYINLLAKHCLSVFNLHGLLGVLDDCGIALSSIESAVILMDRSMKICYANREALNILGLDENGYGENIVSDVSAPWNGSILNNPRKHEKGIKSEYNGRYLSWSVLPLLSEEDVRGWLVVADDCTENYELQKHGTDEEPLTENFLTLSSFAHEIRNPLTVLRGLLQMIMTDKDSREADEYLERCLREIDRVDSLTDNFLQIKKLSEQYTEPVDLNDFLDDIMPILDGSILNKPVRIIVHKHAVRKVNVDPEQLTQVMVNIIKNGAEALDGEGDIHITVREAGREWAELSIHDSGKGIAPDVKKSLFEPFVTTKERGSGLGLFISRAIVRKNRGEISALNRPEGGALFSILLPYKDYDKDKIQRQDILLVSCDDMVRSDAEETLLAEGYKTISVSTIDNALFVLGIYGFSLIILDGAILEIKDYCALKEDYPDVLKIVLVTEGSGKEFTDAHYLQKPLDCRLLIEKVRNLIGSSME